MPVLLPGHEKSETQVTCFYKSNFYENLHTQRPPTSSKAAQSSKYAILITETATDFLH